MLTRKRIRDKRRIKLSQYFQELKPGDKVCLVENLSFRAPFHRRMQGRTAEVIAKQGGAYIVRLLNGKTYKKLTINPIHLKKLK